jgi:hypothetical protein
VSDSCAVSRALRCSSDAAPRGVRLWGKGSIELALLAQGPLIEAGRPVSVGEADRPGRIDVCVEPLAQRALRLLGRDLLSPPL